MSELNPVRIAVIGAGAMGRNHIRFVTEEPEAELVAIADAFEGARATAEAAGVPFFTDPAQMMDEVKPEAVIIATPNDLHLGVAREAVKRNIVPLVEKPISNDLEDAQAFAAEAETAGVPVLVGQHRRHNPFVNKAKEIIDRLILCDVPAGKPHNFDYKTALQELVQRKPNQVLHYEPVSESGPDHAKVFAVAVTLNGQVIGLGSGHSKKEAEQSAARAALEQLQK